MNTTRWIAGGVSATLLALAGGGPTAHAATYIWANSNVNGTPTNSLNWFNAPQGTWTGGTPVSGNGNTIQFFQDNTTFLTYLSTPTQTAVVDNAGSPLELGTLTLSGRGPSSSPTLLTMVIAGDPLQFSGATGTIINNAQGGSHPGYLNYLVSSDIRLGTASSATVLTIDATQNNNGFFRLSGTISELQAGGGSIIKNGSGNLVLSGTNTFSGGFTINAGGVYASGTSTQVLGTGRLTINGGSFSLNTSDGQSPANQLVGSIAGTGGTIFAGNRTLTFGTDNTSSTYQGSWNGGTYTKVGTGTTTVFSAGATVAALSGVTVNGGMLRLGASKNFNTTVIVNANGILDLNGFTSSGDLANGGIYAGGTITTGSGSFTNTQQQFYFHNAGISTFTGNLVLPANPNFRGDANSVLIIDGVLSGAAGSITASGNMSASAVVRLSGSSANTFSGIWGVSAGTVELNKTAGVNAIPTDVTMTAGTLKWLASDQIADTSILTLHGGAINLNGFNETVSSLVMTGLNFMALSCNGVLTLAGASGNVLSLTTENNVQKTLDFDITLSGAGGDIALTSGGANNNTLRIGGTTAGTRTLAIGSATRTVTINDNASMAVDAEITSLITGAGGLIKAGTGLLQVSAANTYGGDTIVSNGTLQLNNLNALQNSTLDTGLAGSQQVTFNVGGTYNVGGLKGADDLAIGANTLSVGANTSNTTYSGVLSGTNGKLTKVGAGTLILAGTNTYTGNTFVNAGALIVNGGLLTGGTTVFVNASATLGGTGVISRITTVASGGNLAPGAASGAGVFTFGASLTLSNNFLYSWDVGTTSTDRLDVASLTLVAGAATAWTLQLGVDGAAPGQFFGESATNNVLVLMQATAGVLPAALTNSIALVPGTWQTNQTTLVYFSPDQTQLLLTGVYLVPEPGAVTLCVAGIVALLLVHRRRRQ